MKDRVYEIRGCLFDLDGVLHVGDEPIPGARRALSHIRSKGIPCRFLTNTTTKSLESLHQKLNSMDLPIEKDEILSSSQAAVQYLRRLGNPTCFLVLAEDVMSDFREFTLTDRTPDVVVIGDIGETWDYQLLNRIFGMLIEGASLIALHRGKYWQTEDGLRLDIGIFVSGLEYVTGREAVIMGKPSPEFFKIALRSIGIPAGDTIMVGDDIESDVGGAQKAGIRGVLVKTGKYREELVARSSVIPYRIISSVAELADLF